MISLEKLIYDKDKKFKIFINSKEECVQELMSLYRANDVSMWDILGTTYICGFCLEDIVDIYGECMNLSDSDVLVRFTEEINNDIIQDAIVYGL